MSELLDIYDPNGVKIGVKAREAVHRDGDWHRTFHCWVIYRDAAGRDYVVMQWRGPEKDICPNLLDVSAAGHYEAGETIRDGVREISEELGLNVAFDDLIPVGMRTSVLKDGDLLDYQFEDVFLLICDKPLSEYAYQREEISGLVRFTIDDGLSMFSGESDTIPAEAVGLDRPVMELHRDNFVPAPDGYIYRLLILARRCLNGEKHLVI